MTNINRFDFRNARLGTIVMMWLFDRAKKLIGFRNGGDRHPLRRSKDQELNHRGHRGIQRKPYPIFLDFLCGSSLYPLCPPVVETSVVACWFMSGLMAGAEA